MPRLYSSRIITRTLVENGFEIVSQKGSHVKFFSIRQKRIVIVPANKKTIPAGTFASILRQSGLEKEDFE